APQTITVNRAATALKAAPVITIKLPLRITILSLGARLTRQDDGAPIAGQPVAMKAGTGTLVCSATTDTEGYARCTAPLPSVVALALNLGYSATYAGSTNYVPSSANGSLL